MRKPPAHLWVPIVSSTLPAGALVWMWALDLLTGGVALAFASVLIALSLALLFWRVAELNRRLKDSQDRLINKLQLDRKKLIESSKADRQKFIQLMRSDRDRVLEQIGVVRKTLARVREKDIPRLREAPRELADRLLKDQGRRLKAAAESPARPMADHLSREAGEGGVRFRARPYVCGAIGRWSPEVMQRLRDASPGELEEVHRSSTATIWASGLVERWRAEGRHGIYWAPIASGAPPTTWRDAAENRLAAGLAFEDGSVILHACAVGYQELYTRRIGDALYFSVRIHSLVDLDASPLHVDWSTWANIFAITCPLGDETPFQEIRRVVGATGWSARGDRLEPISFEPTWLGLETDEDLGAGEILEILAGHLPGEKESVGLMLSGGWDSRLLAILAARATGPRVHAWTTSNDDGRDLDIEYARQVAEVLGFSHHVLLPGPEAWVEDHAVVRQRVEYQSVHHIWLMPLARELHCSTRPLLDGLAGDVLFKSRTRFVDGSVVDAETPGARRRALWSNLAEGRLDETELLADGLAASFEAMSREAFDRAIGRFDGHPAAPTLGVLHSRTVRAIALSPLSIVGPEVPVLMPFAAADVMAAAMRLPGRKRDGRIYREILRRASSEVAALPSTNDERAIQSAAGRRRQSTAAALASMADAVLACEPVRNILSQEVLSALSDPLAREKLGRARNARRFLNWASLYAEWQARYADRLSASSLSLPG